MQWIVLVIGIMIGSFLNVAIYRLPKQEDVLISRSYCPKCNTKLQALDLIPILSFLFNKGKCRYCNKSISIQYPTIELITGGIIWLLYKEYGLTPYFFSISFMSFNLIIASCIDYKKGIIPNEITYLSVAVGLSSSIFFLHITFQQSLFGTLIPLFLVILLVENQMGGGDIKLLSAVGSFLGLKYVLVILFLASIIGSLVVIILALFNFIDIRAKIPFAPFISVSTLIMIFLGNQVLSFLY